MNLFVNRDDELNALDCFYSLPGSQLVVVYGRRRLGKTRLLRQFAANKPNIYYMADRAGEVSQRAALARCMAATLREPILEDGNYSSWYDLLAAFDRVRSTQQKTVLILDEYQYLCQTDRSMSSRLQKWWDEHWKDESIFVILCGSLTSMMYRETLAQSSPLYGRSVGHILLKPLAPPYVRHFLDHPTETSCMERYALCGGVPRYLELLAPFPSLYQALEEGVLAPSAALHHEARYLLQDEVDVPNVCWSILEAIANGAHRISEIAARLQQPANQLTRYIALLRDLAILERDVPILEKTPAKSKKGIYTISDPFLALWFGAVYPYESFFEFGDLAAVKSKIGPRIERHIASCYEYACREYLKRRTPALDCMRIGRQWGPHYEIDVAGINQHGQLSVVGECKWSRQKVGMSILRDLEAKIQENHLPLAGNAKWALFSRSGFTAALQQYANDTPNTMLVKSVF